MTQTSPPWIGQAPTRMQFVAVMFIGILGVLIAGLQPLLLGTLAQEGRVSAAQLGYAATAELLMMGLAAGFAGARLRAERIVAYAIGACAAFAALNYATVHVGGGGLAIVRALAGIPEGVMIWIASAMIARSPLPERAAGVYLTSQTLAQFVVATLLAAFVIPSHGANGGFLWLAMLSMCGLIVAFALPSRFASLTSEDMPTRPPARGFVALLATCLYLAFIVGVWVYAEPLSRQAGHAPTVAGTAVSISLACQVLGGACATYFASRLLWFPTVLVCSALNFGCLVAFALLPSPAMFLVTSGVFGFLWLFVLPFFVPMTIEADPTRRAAVLLAGAQLLGGSLGPTLVAFLVTDADVRNSLSFGMGALLFALMIMFALRYRTAAAQRLTAS